MGSNGGFYLSGGFSAPVLQWSPLQDHLSAKLSPHLSHTLPPLRHSVIFCHSRCRTGRWDRNRPRGWDFGRQSVIIQRRTRCPVMWWPESLLFVHRTCCYSSKTCRTEEQYDAMRGIGVSQGCFLRFFVLCNDFRWRCSTTTPSRRSRPAT